jgi:hypothetical protein
MTSRFTDPTRHPSTSRKDLQMTHIELRLASILERQSLERSIRDADRAAMTTARSIRTQLGESIVRLGRRVAGESLSSPAWTG